MTVDSRIADILADWRLRWEAGDRQDPEEIVRAHPDVADELRERFAVACAVDPAIAEAFARPSDPVRLGAYRVLERLGSGGMGTVFLAEAERAVDEFPAGERVALKVLRPEHLAREGFIERFQREAEAGRRIRHENVVRTFAADRVDPGGRPAHFLVMEYVEGRTLHELGCDFGTVPEALLREIARQLAAGLAAIHAEGIVHRDLKPSNAIITHDHHVRIMDLGMVRRPDDSMTLTEEGQFAGSLPYAAPEQFRDSRVGPAADLYALGVLLYELATGRNPFRRDDPVAVMGAHLDEVPAAVCDVIPDVSTFLSEVIATLLRKEARERFPGASELLAVLLAGERSSWWEEREQAIRETAPRAPRIPVQRETRLYGRETELDLLRDAWARAEDGDGACLLLEGEAGIGKSRLVDAFLDDFGNGAVRILYGSYPPSGGLGGLSDALLAHFGRAGLEDGIRPLLRETPALVPAFAALVRRETPDPETAPISGDALHAVFGHLLRGMAEEKPLVWIVEDLHFADPDSRKILLTLARTLADHRVLLVLTTRPGLPEDELAHLGRLPQFGRAGVGRLSAREVVLLLQDAFRSEHLADRLGARISLKSDGVPFFVFEMIRGLKDGEFISELPDGSYVESKEIDRIEVPSAVRDLIGARLRGLGKDERSLLDVGAVDGFEFDPDLLARTLDRPRIAVLQDLAEIERRSGVVAPAGPVYRFDHHQLQEVVYEDLSDGLRQEYHTLLARAIAAREGVADLDPRDLPGETACRLAHHGLRGREPCEAAPTVVPALAHLKGAYRHDAFFDLADRALAIDGLLGGADRAEVLLERSESLAHVGRGPEMAADIEEALAVAEESGSVELTIRARLARGKFFEATSRLDEALREREAILELARRSGDRAGEARARGGCATALFLMGRHEEADVEFAAALEAMAGLDDADLEAAIRINRGLFLMTTGRYDEARESYENGIELARECGNRLWEANAFANLGNLHKRLGQVDRKLECLETATALMRECGHRIGEAMCGFELARMKGDLGCRDEARSRCESALAIFRQAGHRDGEAGVLDQLGNLAHHDGRYGRALEAYLQAEEVVRESGDRGMEAMIGTSLALTDALLGRPDEARERLDHVETLARELGLPQEPGDVRLGRAQIHDCLGETEEAIREAGEALAVYREISHGQQVGGALVFRGGLLARAGRHEEARADLEEALALAREGSQDETALQAECGLATLPGGDPTAVITAFERDGAALRHGVRMGILFDLWKVTGDSARLEEAALMLEHLRENAPAECRGAMVENVRLHQEILEARGKESDASAER